MWRLLLFPMLLLAGLPQALAYQPVSQPSTQPATTPSTLPATNPAADSPLDPGEPPAAVAELLRQLDDPAFAEREAAEARLLEQLKQDPALRDHVAHAGRHDPSPEVRARCASVLAQYEQFVQFGETRITLHVEDVHPRQLFAALSEESGVKFEYWPQNPWESDEGRQEVSLDLENVPFWEALKRAGELTGVHPVEHQVPPPGGLTLSQHGESIGDVPIHYSGAFAVQLRRLQRNENVAVVPVVDEAGQIRGDNHVNRNLHVELRVLVEPKVRLSEGISQPTIQEAVDEAGNSLLVAGQDGRHGGGWFNANSRWTFAASVPLDPRLALESQRLAKLRGFFEAQVALEVDQLDIPLSELADLSRLENQEPLELSKRYTVGPYELEFVSIRRPNEQQLQLEVQMEVTQADMEDQNAWARRQHLLSTLQLVDAQGRAWDNNGGGNDWDGQKMKVTRIFGRHREPLGEAVRIVWEVPVRTATVTIPFEFTDVPLPVAE